MSVACWLQVSLDWGAAVKLWQHYYFLLIMNKLSIITASCLFDSSIQRASCEWLKAKDFIIFCHSQQDQMYNNVEND